MHNLEFFAIFNLCLINMSHRRRKWMRVGWKEKLTSPFLQNGCGMPCRNIDIMGCPWKTWMLKH